MAGVDYSGHPSLRVRERDRALPEDAAESGGAQGPRVGAQQIGQQYQGRAGVGTAGIDIGHDEDVQAAADQHDPDVQQSGDGLLLHGLHAVLDFHAEVHRDPVQAIGVGVIVDYRHSRSGV